MASPAPVPVIPPLNKNALIGIWIETSLWGMNCIVYAIAMYVLFKKLEKPKVLATTSTILFVLGTAHVSLSLAQLLDAFINIPVPPPPLYSILYWGNYADGKSVAKTVLYDTSVFVQDMVLIWRLYVVWSRNWKVVVLPIIIEMAHMGTAYAATGLLSRPGADINSPDIVHIGPVGWSLDLAVNILVTAAIAGRLWYMGNKVDSIQSTKNKYLATIFTIIESGAIFAAVTMVMLILYERGSVLALNGIDISTQLAVLTPLLIISRVGIGMVHGLPNTISFAYPTHSISTNLSSTFEMNRAGGQRSGSHGQIVITKQHGTTTDDSSYTDRGKGMTVV